MSYIGNTATQQAFTPAIDYFSGNASTTAFTLSRPVASVAQVQAVIENVPQNPGSAFTVSGNTITFTSAPPSGTNNIYVYYTSPITQVIQPGQGTVQPTSLSTGGPYWDTSGNLGLGVTPSAWGSLNTGFQIGRAGSLSARKSSGTVLDLSSNAYLNSSPAWIYTQSDYATLYEQANGAHSWSTAPSGTAGNAISFTQAMTLDASGNLGVGTGSNTAYGRVDSVASSYAAYVARATTTGVGKSVDALKVVDATAANFATGVYSATAHIWNYNGSIEAMRIDTSGSLLLGTTSQVWNSERLAVYGNSTSDSVAAWKAQRTIGQHVFLNNTGALSGYINWTGTTTSYITSSDYRLKDNVQPMTGALAKVAHLNPVTYTWKADGSAGQGFIAHELQEVVPDCVIGEKDAVETYIDEDGNEQTRPVYQGIDTSFLVATLTAAIQEQQALIQSLTARIEALENK